MHLVHPDRRVTDDVKPVFGIKTQCTLIMLPHAQPQGVHGLIFSKFNCSGQELCGNAFAVILLRDVKSLNFNGFVGVEVVFDRRRDVAAHLAYARHMPIHPRHPKDILRVVQLRLYQVNIERLIQVGF